MDIIQLFEEYTLAIMTFLPFFAQMGLPTGITFFLLWTGSVSTSTTLFLGNLFPIAAAFVAGDIAAYWIGKRYLARLLEKAEHPRIRKATRKSGRLLNKYGSLAILFTRTIFIGLAPALNYVYGMEKIRFRKFFILIIFGELIYVSLYMGLGLYFQETWEEILSIIKNFSYFILGIIGLVIVGKQLHLHIKKHYLKKALKR